MPCPASSRAQTVADDIFVPIVCVFSVPKFLFRFHPVPVGFLRSFPSADHRSQMEKSEGERGERQNGKQSARHSQNIRSVVQISSPQFGKRGIERRKKSKFFSLRLLCTARRTSSSTL